MNYMEELKKHIYKFGLEGLLPQNLPINLLRRMIAEIDSYERGNTDAEASTLLMAILSIKSGNFMKIFADKAEINFDTEEDFADNFHCYMTSVILEGLRHDKPIDIATESLPTLKNIFDKDRKIEIAGLELT